MITLFNKYEPIQEIQHKFEFYCDKYDFGEISYIRHLETKKLINN
jgi:hypothetical protein